MNERANVDDWQVQQLRLTCFLVDDPTAGEAERWWEHVVQEPPEDVQSKPKIPTYTAVGTLFDQQVRMTLQAHRVDWLIASPEGMVDMDVGTWASIGRFPEGLDEMLVPLSQRWWELDLHFSRIALGCEVFIPLANPEAGFAVLRERFNVTVPYSPGATDVVYQINRPRLDEGNETNRLMKWTILTLHGRHITVDFGNPQANPRQVIEEEPLHSCRLALDINTIPQEGLTLGNAAAETRFRSLVDDAKEIFVGGATP